MVSPFNNQRSPAPFPSSSAHKLPRPPIYNPYDKFTQSDFDAWIGGITGALKQALGQESPIEPVPRPLSSLSDASSEEDELVAAQLLQKVDSDDEDSFAAIHTRRAINKGKARDPRDGPGLGAGHKDQPIEIDLDSEEDVDEVGSGSDEGEVSEEWDEDEPSEDEAGQRWDQGESSAQARIRHETEREEDLFQVDDDDASEGEEEQGDDQFDEEVEDTGYYEEEEELQHPSDRFRQPEKEASIVFLPDEDQESPERDLLDENEALDEESDGELVSIIVPPPASALIHDLGLTRSPRSALPTNNHDEAIDVNVNGKQNLLIATCQAPEFSSADTTELSLQVVEIDELEDDIEEALPFGIPGQPSHLSPIFDVQQVRAMQAIPMVGQLECPIVHAESFDAEGEKLEAQPPAKNTSSPPLAVESGEIAHGSDHIEIRDPWSGPRVYAEDYDSSGDASMHSDNQYDAHHLGCYGDATPILTSDQVEQLVYSILANKPLEQTDDVTFIDDEVGGEATVPERPIQSSDSPILDNLASLQEETSLEAWSTIGTISPEVNQFGERFLEDQVSSPCIANHPHIQEDEPPVAFPSATGDEELLETKSPLPDENIVTEALRDISPGLVNARIDSCEADHSVDECIELADKHPNLQDAASDLSNIEIQHISPGTETAHVQPAETAGDELFISSPGDSERTIMEARKGVASTDESNTHDVLGSDMRGAEGYHPSNSHSLIDLEQDGAGDSFVMPVVLTADLALGDSGSPHRNEQLVEDSEAWPLRPEPSRSSPDISVILEEEPGAEMQCFSLDSRMDDAQPRITNDVHSHSDGVQSNPAEDAKHSRTERSQSEGAQLSHLDGVPRPCVDSAPLEDVQSSQNPEDSPSDSSNALPLADQVVSPIASTICLNGDVTPEKVPQTLLQLIPTCARNVPEPLILGSSGMPVRMPFDHSADVDEPIHEPTHMLGNHPLTEPHFEIALDWLHVSTHSEEQNPGGDQKDVMQPSASTFDIWDAPRKYAVGSISAGDGSFLLDGADFNAFLVTPKSLEAPVNNNELDTSLPESIPTSSDLADLYDDLQTESLEKLGEDVLDAASSQGSTQVATLSSAESTLNHERSSARGNVPREAQEFCPTEQPLLPDADRQYEIDKGTSPSRPGIPGADQIPSGTSFITQIARSLQPSVSPNPKTDNAITSHSEEGVVTASNPSIPVEPITCQATIDPIHGQHPYNGSTPLNVFHAKHNVIQDVKLGTFNSRSSAQDRGKNDNLDSIELGSIESHHDCSETNCVKISSDVEKEKLKRDKSFDQDVDINPEGDIDPEFAHPGSSKIFPGIFPPVTSADAIGHDKVNDPNSSPLSSPPGREPFGAPEPKATGELPSILIIKKLAHKTNDHLDSESEELTDLDDLNATKKRKIRSTTTSPTHRVMPVKKLPRMMRKVEKHVKVESRNGKIEKVKGKEREREARIQDSPKSFETISFSSGSSSGVNSSKLLHSEGRTTSRASSIASIAASDHSHAIQPSSKVEKPNRPRQPPPPLFHKHSHALPQPPTQRPPSSPLPAQQQSPSKPSQAVGSVASAWNAPTSKSQPTPARKATLQSYSSPVTRSNCRYHKISIPRDEDGPRIYFLVPGCSLTDPELIEEEEVFDHGDATSEDTADLERDLASLAFDPYLVGVMRLLVGVNMWEQEVYYMRRLDEEGKELVPKLPSKAPMATPAPLEHESPRTHARSPTSPKQSLSAARSYPAARIARETDKISIVSSTTDSENSSDHDDGDYLEGKLARAPLSKATTSEAPPRKTHASRGSPWYPKRTFTSLGRDADTDSRNTKKLKLSLSEPWTSR